MNKKNISILCCICVIIASLIYIISNNHVQERKTVYIYKNGELLKTINMDNLTETAEYSVGNDNTNNIILVENNRVCMKFADCPDKLCVEQGWIEDSSVPIVCLPNKVVVKIN